MIGSVCVGFGDEVSGGQIGSEARLVPTRFHPSFTNMGDWLFGLGRVVMARIRLVPGKLAVRSWVVSQ